VGSSRGIRHRYKFPFTAFQLTRSILRSFCWLGLFFLFPPGSTAEPPVVLALPANEEGLARFQQWKPITDYLTETSGSTLILEMVEDHPSVRRGLERNLYDLAFVNPVWYVFLAKLQLCKPLARPIVASRDTFRSLLIVHRDSIVRNVDDLLGGTIALTGPFESALGYFLPLALLESHGLSVSSYDKILFSDTFPSILKGVAYGKLEAGFVSSSVLDERDNASLREQVRVVLESEAIPQWTVVARPGVRQETITAVRQALLEMGKSEQGRAVLSPTGFSAFVGAFDSDYDVVRRYLGAVEDLVASPE
jgi:phosphonate transport system substrate-binding protein